MAYDYDERYNPQIDHGPRQKPKISRREAARLKTEYDNFWYIYWLMQPYALTHQFMDFNKGVYSFIKF